MQQQLDPYSEPGNYIVSLLQQQQQKQGQANRPQKDLNYFNYCLLFFGLIYLFAVFFVGVGNPKILGKPFDSSNQACGVDVGFEKYPFIYFVQPLSGSTWKTLCVSECPDDDKAQSLDCHPNTVTANCDKKPDNIPAEYQTLIYKSVAYKNVCLPLKAEYYKQVIDSSSEPFLVSILTDINNAQYLILSILIFSIILKQIKNIQNSLLFFVMIIKYKWFIYFLLIASIVCLLILTGVSLIIAFGSMGVAAPSTGDITPAKAIEMAHSYFGSSGILFTVVLFFIVLVLGSPVYMYYYREKVKRIKEDLEIIDRFISPHLMQYLELTAFLTVLMIIFSFLWFGLELNTFSFGQRSDDQKLPPFQKYSISLVSYPVGFFNIVFFIVVQWILVATSSFLIQAFVQQKYKGYVVHYQNTHNLQPQYNLELKQDSDFISLFLETLKYHIGSIIYGQVKFTKHLFQVDLAYFLTYFNDQDFDTSIENAAKMGESYHQFTQNPLYIQYIFYGKNLGDFYSRFFYFSVGNISALLAYLLIAITPISAQLSNPTVPVIVVYLFTIYISKLFANIHGKTLDALNQLLLMDYTKKEQKKGEEIQIGTVGFHAAADIRILAQHFQN